jgi:hypothetical protein
MIEIFEGRLGGGKTYTAVERMANVLAQGEVVCTNIRLRPENLQKMVAARAGVEIELDQIIVLDNSKIPDFHRHVPWGDLRGAGKTRVLVVVDEAHLYFNSRDWAKTSRDLLAFLTQSDKVSVDIIFISQSALNIDKQFGRLVQYIWRFRDLSKWKIPILSIQYPLNQILACQYDYDGITLLQRWFRTKKPQVFDCYETAALLTDFPTLEGIRAKRDLKKVEPKDNNMKMIMVGILIFGAIALGSNFVRKKEPAAATAAVPKAPGAKPTETKKEKPLYEIYEEVFRSYWGHSHTLGTTGGSYTLGEMSNKGFVTAVSLERAKIALPDGRTGWVLATGRETVPASVTASPPAESLPKSPPIQPASPAASTTESTLSDRESQRMRQWIHKPLSSNGRPTS